jgi:PucR family transcriptional regulator, purine catabolism regulatory protein
LVHLVDHPDVLPWVGTGQLLLTTGFHWPKPLEEQKKLVKALSKKGLVGVVLAVPNFLSQFEASVRQEADEYGLVLLEVPWNVPFSQITEDVHRALLNEQSHLISRSEEIHRSMTRAAADAGSVQDLASTLASLIERGVRISDDHGAVLGHRCLGKSIVELWNVELWNVEP